MSRFISVLLLMMFVCIAPQVNAQVYLTPDQYSGSASTANDGVTGSLFMGSFKLQWSITAPNQNGTQYYHYVYNITDTSGAALSPKQKSFLLEVDPSITSSNGTLVNANPGIQGGPKTYTNLDILTLPQSIYAIDLSTPNNAAGSYSFDSTKAPVWGDFYVQINSLRYAYNTGFGSNPRGAPFTNWVPTPGALSLAVPEPKIVLLMGSFLMLAYVYRRRHA